VGMAKLNFEQRVIQDGEGGWGAVPALLFANSTRLRARVIMRTLRTVARPVCLWHTLMQGLERRPWAHLSRLRAVQKTTPHCHVVQPRAAQRCEWL
jgi:hypothetical protein